MINWHVRDVVNRPDDNTKVQTNNEKNKKFLKNQDANIKM